MAERAFGLLSATANGQTGAIVSALGQKAGIYYWWVTGHSAVVELVSRPHPDTPWQLVTTVTAGAAGAAASGTYSLSRYYGYLASRTVAIYSAAGGSAQWSDFLQMVN